MDTKGKQPSKSDFYVTVKTAHSAPSWMPYAIYAVLVGCAYLHHQTHVEYWIIPMGVVGCVMAHLFFSTYNTLVHMYNSMRIRDAVMARYYQLTPEQRQEVPAGPQLQAGSKLLGIDATKVEPNPTSDESIILRRYYDALKWINDKAVNIGDARDRAWRALEWDSIRERRGTLTKKNMNSGPPILERPANADKT